MKDFNQLKWEVKMIKYCMYPKTSYAFTNTGGKTQICKRVNWRVKTSFGKRILCIFSP